MTTTQEATTLLLCEQEKKRSNFQRGREHTTQEMKIPISSKKSIVLMMREELSGGTSISVDDTPVSTVHI